MTAAERQHPPWTGLHGIETGHQIADASAALARGAPGHVGSNFGQSGEQAVAGQVGGGPDRPPLEAAVPLAHHDDSGWAGLRREEHGDVGVDGGLVFLSRST